MSKWCLLSIPTCIIIGLCVGWEMASNLCFVAGIVVLLRGLCRYVSHVGVFQSTKYSFSQFKRTFQNKNEETPIESYYSYRQRTAKPSKGYTADLVVASGLIILSIICALLL